MKTAMGRPLHCFSSVHGPLAFFGWQVAETRELGNVLFISHLLLNVHSIYFGLAKICGLRFLNSLHTARRGEGSNRHVSSMKYRFSS